MTTAWESHIARSSFAFLLTSVTAAAISPVRAQCPDTGYFVTIDRKPVRSDGSANLLELLTRNVSPFRLGLLGASPDDHPVVVIDGVLVSDGARAIATLSSHTVDSVTILRPTAAVARLGARGAHGAILVTTRSGRAASPLSVSKDGSCIPRNPNAR